MDLTQKDLMGAMDMSEELKDKDEDAICMKVLKSEKNML